MQVIQSILQEYPLSPLEVALLIRTAPSRYKVHEIEKRNGRGKRTIAQPTAEVKLVQRLMVDEVIKKLPISDAAMAYRSGHGILDHALPHANHQYLLKLDFKDFFPSIRAADFVRHLIKYSKIDRDEAKLLARLFFWRPKGQRQLILSIGAPSSPAISNTIMFDFDVRLIEYCKKAGITYTRYADDLALSTNTPNLLSNAYKFVLELCGEIKSPHLTLNEEKTVFTSKKYHRQLTGLTLSNDGKASVGRERKRLIRAMAYRYKTGVLPLEEHSKLRGWLSFILSVDKLFVESISLMIGEENYAKLMNG